MERLAYAECIRRYDRPGTLFFIDPPYMGSEHYYGAGLFPPDEFARLADQLAQLRGRFILTINDCPEARRIFARFPMQAHGLHYGVGGGAKTKQVQELIIQKKG